MKLPFAAKARVDRRKIVNYLLSPSHPDGASKAKFFTSFGFKLSRWQILARALRRHGTDGEVSSFVESKYGTRYSVDGLLEAADGRRPRIRSVWILAKRSRSPRLITAYPIQEQK
jgi:hypothetical protein